LRFFLNPEQCDREFLKILNSGITVFGKFSATQPDFFFILKGDIDLFFKNYPITTGSLPKKLPGNVVPHGLTAFMQTAIGQGSKRKKAVMVNTKN